MGEGGQVGEAQRLDVVDSVAADVDRVEVLESLEEIGPDPELSWSRVIIEGSSLRAGSGYLSSGPPYDQHPTASSGLLEPTPSSLY